MEAEIIAYFGFSSLDGGGACQCVESRKLYEVVKSYCLPAARKPSLATLFLPLGNSQCDLYITSFSTTFIVSDIKSSKGGSSVVHCLNGNPA